MTKTKQKYKYTSRDIYNAEHPARRKAIRILEEIELITGVDFDNETYYRLEDNITLIINDK